MPQMHIHHHFSACHVSQSGWYGMCLKCRLQTVCAMPPNHLQATNAMGARHALSAVEREPSATTMASAAMSREPVFVTAVTRYAHACSSCGSAYNIEACVRACMHASLCVFDI